MNNLPSATAAKPKGLALLPAPEEWAQMKELANVAVKSQCLPSSIRTPEAALIIALKGWELGLPPMLAWSYIIVISGKPTIAPELMLAYIRKDFPGAEFVWDASESHCVLKAKRQGDKEFTEFRWDLERAKKMGLADRDNWKKQPGTMMRWRCVAEMKRFLFPEVLMGIDYISDELEGARDVTPPASTMPESAGGSGASNVAAKSIKNFAVVPPVEPPAPTETENAAIDVQPEEVKGEEQGELNFEEPPKVEAVPTRDELVAAVNAEFKRLKWKAPRVQEMIKKTFNKSPAELTDNELSAFIGILAGYKEEA